GLQGPLIRQHLQQRSLRTERASILSLKSLLFRLGFIAAAPLVGMLADHAGLSVTFAVLLTVLLLLLLPVSLKFLSSTRNGQDALSTGTDPVV
ncbi:MAG: MFS transporter, partial [Desulfuromonadales bacterium]